MSLLTRAPSGAAAGNEFRDGWPVVLACFGVATFAWGFGFYGQSVFLAELHATRGWPTSLIASATTLYYLMSALLLARVHRVLETVGPRLTLAAGVAILAAGAIGISRVQAPWQLFLCSLVMAAGWATTTTTAIALTLARWFDLRRGLALSLALTGASAGGFIVAPLLVRLVQLLGLEQAVLLLALGGLAILLPLVLAGIGRPAPSARPPPARSPPARSPLARPPSAPLPPAALPSAPTGDAAILESRTAPASQAAALRSRHVWSVALPFALALAAQVGFIVHQVAFLLPRLGSDGAGNAIAATAIAAAIGRLALAPLIDRLDQRIAAAGSFASQAAGLFAMLLLPDEAAVLYAGSVVFGLSVGNVITLPALIIQREFAPHAYGIVVGFSSMVSQATLAFGPAVLGLARDATGSYRAALLVCIALQLAAAVLVLRRPRGAAPRLAASRVVAPGG
ncbi:MAG: MFS transporter [Acetobacteraceae bacterium]